jgi:DNA polymerase-3 subunit gamma/tau
VRDKVVQVADYQPAYCRYKIFIIDEVHDLSPKAFDALLKTVEEPPAHVVFILATTEYSKVPPTIRARCQKHDFHRASLSNLITRLEFVAKAEGVESEHTALAAIARLADGGYRDALTLLEQAMIVGQGKITLQQVYDQLGMIGEDAVDDMLLAMREGDVKKLLDLLDDVYRLGRDPRVVLESMLYRLSELTRATYGIDIGAGEDAALEASLHEISTRIGREHLNRFRAALADAHKVVRDVSLPRLWLEAELVTMATGPVLTPPAAPRADAVEPNNRVVAAPAPAKGSEPVKQPEPAVIEPPQPSGDPLLDDVRAKWTLIQKNIAGISPSAAARLSKVTVASFQDGIVVLEFTREMDLDWVKDSPKRQGLIREQINAVVGEPGWTLDWTLKKNRVKHHEASETVAVELPAEGAKLAEIGREIFEGV